MSYVSKQINEISAQNSTSEYSYSKGYPIISFRISELPQVMIGSSIRLNATLNVKDSTGASVDNLNARGSGLKAGTISSRAGAYSCIEQLTWSDGSDKVLETISNYGRYICDSTQMNSTASDLDQNMGITSLTASRSANCAVGVNNGRSFSIALKSGLTSNDFSLDKNGVNGLIGNIQLAPDSMVISGYIKEDGTVDNNSSTGYTYSLSDVSLSYDTLIPDAQTQAKMQVPSPLGMTFNSVQTLYSTVQSSDETVVMVLNSSMVLSTSSSFLPTTFMNSYSADSFALPKLAKAFTAPFTTDAIIDRVSFIRGSSLFPYVDELEVKGGSEINRTMVETLKPAMMSWKKGYGANSLLSNTTENGFITSTNQITGLDDARTNQADQRPSYSLGVSQDIYGVGLDYKNINYSVRIVSDLPGDVVNGMFTYVLSKNILFRGADGQVRIQS
jgi:hypothetical protein